MGWRALAKHAQPVTRLYDRLHEMGGNASMGCQVSMWMDVGPIRTLLHPALWRPDLSHSAEAVMFPTILMLLIQQHMLWAPFSYKHVTGN